MQLLIDVYPRNHYLNLIADSRILIALPYIIGEAAFLTALEGMLLDVVVVMPDILGPHGPYIDGYSLHHHRI